MSSYAIRTLGDPTLRQRARPVEQFDGTLAATCDAMIDTMVEAVGGGLAAPQVGISRRLFVYGSDDGPRVAINPEIVEESGEDRRDEACLSLPGFSFEITRSAVVTLRALDLDGREYLVATDGYAARMFQHEIDHLDGVLTLDRVDPETRKAALRQIREQGLVAVASGHGPVRQP